VGGGNLRFSHSRKILFFEKERYQGNCGVLARFGRRLHRGGGICLREKIIPFRQRKEIGLFAYIWKRIGGEGVEKHFYPRKKKPFHTNFWGLREESNRKEHFIWEKS